MMNIYVLPSGEEALGDAMFDDEAVEREGNRQQLRFWKTFKDACAKRGIEVHTSDFYDPRKKGNDDMLIVHVHPEGSFLRRALHLIKNRGRKENDFALERRRFLLDNYTYFKRRMLLQAEPPVTAPRAYNNLPRIKKSGLYEKIFLVCRGFGGEFEYFNYFTDGAGDIVSSYFSSPKEKFLVLMNANNPPRSLKHELFGERLAAIRYFSGVPGFDLYGPRWDRAPRHPFFWHYGKYAKRCWRGTVEGKMPVVSRYKFMICYENCVYDGYVSEKIFDCMAVGVIPIYLGAPDIASLVPDSCFVDRRKFQSYEELHHFLMSLSEGDLERYRSSMLNFLRSRPSDGMERFLDRLLA